MKKTLAFVLAAMMLLSSCFPAGAVTLQAVESAADTVYAKETVTEDAVLASAGTLVPGENFLTGAATYETFEGYEVGVKPSYVRADDDYSDYAISEDTDLRGKLGKNKSFKFILNDNFPQLYWGLSNNLDAGRKYFISLELCSDADSGFTNFWLMQSGASDNAVHTGFHDDLKAAVSAGEWLKFSKTVTSVTSNKFYFQMGASADIQKVKSLYADNFAFVPYYKINYVGSDTEYVLFADENDKDLTKLMTTYTVKSDNYPVWEGNKAKLCKGWTLEQGGTTPVTEIELNGADITLYPIWEEYDFSISCETPSVESDYGTTAVVTADGEAKWIIDVGDTFATYTVAADGKSVTVTSGGFSGEVTVKASPVSKPEITVMQKIAFVGGDSVRPGINIFTGNALPYDFEGDTSKVVFHNASSAVASSYADDNGKTVNAVVVREKDGDTDNHAASVDGNGYYFYLDYRFPVIDKERPVKIDYDYILGLGGSQVRTLINYPTTYKGNQRERATFAIYLLAEQKTEEWRHATVSKSTADQYKYTNGVVYYPGGEDLNFVSFINYSGKAQASYFDNIVCMPYYKITYHLNGGNGVAEDEYFLQDAGTTYTFLNTGDTVYRNGYAFKGWATSADATAKDVITSKTVELGKDIELYAVWEEDATVPDKYLIELYDGETLRSSAIVEEGKSYTPPYEEFTDKEFLLGWATADGNTLVNYKFYPTEDMKLYASWGEKAVKPGVNVFENGDFETAGVIDLRPSNGKVEIVDENGNKVLKYTRGSDHASVQHCVVWDEGRMYKAEFKVKTPVANSAVCNAVYGGANHGFGANKATAAGEWTTHAATFTFPTDEYTALNNDVISYYVNPNTGAEENVVYYDDLVFIPYYKVTYDANGGEGQVPAGTQLLDGDYTVDTEAVLTREGYTFLGWSLKPGSVNLVTSVTPTPGEDITLYAAWHNDAWDEAVTYEFDSDKAGIANGTITVTQNEETAAYTSAEVYLADESGILEDYTRFARFTFENGVGSYEISGNRAFPAEATRLAVKFIGEELEDLYYWYKIPESKRLVLDEKPLYTFWALSDLHLNGTNYNTDYWPEMPINRENAMRDVVSTDVDFAFINGDLVCYGDTNYLKVLQSYLDDKLNNPEYNKNKIPFFLASGNHEYYENSVSKVDNDEVASYFNAQVDWLEENYGSDFNYVRGGGSNIWYAASNDKVNMVFLQNPEPDEKFTVCEEQLRFLDEQLYNGEKSSKTNLVITHSPVAGTIPSNTGFAGGIANSAAVKEILAKHPNTIVFSAHTHTDLSYEDAHITVVNDMTTNASHINDGCLVWLDAWDGVGTDGAGHDRSFSTGVYVEVYEGKIYVRSRKFMADSMYFGHGVYIIETPDGEVADHTVTMTGKTEDGETLTALVDGVVPADDAQYTYEWTVGGEVVSTEKTYTVDIKGNYADKRVILRVTFADGSYASDISETAFDGIKVTYDANGGTGSVPKSHLWVPGYAVQPDIGTAAPSKEGKFFVGWSPVAGAVKPVSEAVIEEDTTLYAVYSDKPEFYFDANLSGFKSDGYKSKITDGVVNTYSSGGDYYYNWSNGKFDADTYKYMRIKSQYVKGSGDGMFFAVDSNDDSMDKGITADTRMAISAGKVASNTADGFTVKEYDMSTNKYWKNGMITALRFDVLAHEAGSEVNIDYVVFSDKPGAYVVDIAVEEGSTTATASEASNVTAGKAVWNGNIVTVTVALKEGYVFTFEDELAGCATINGYPVQKAVFNGDGTADITVDFDNVIVKNASMIIGSSSDTELYYANFGKALGECVIVAGAYNEKGRLLGTDIIMRCDDTDGVINVNVAKSLGCAYVKAFAFESATSIKVIAEAAVTEGNLAVNGDAEGTETTAFFSENGTVSIVNDEEKGNVWQVVPATGTLYTYFNYKFKYIPGATYKISADIKLVGTSASNEVSGYINMNARYTRKDISGYDHIINATSCKAGEWKHVEYTLTIPEDLDSKTNEQFTLYSNPITVSGTNYGASFRIDNVQIHLFSVPEEAAE